MHAFEPFALVRDQLQRQIEENQLDNITLHPLGLGNDNTRLPFYAPTGSNAGIGSFDADSTSKGNVRAGDLALARATIIFRNKGIDRIDLVKIDVEGFEKFACRDCASVCAERAPLSSARSPWAVRCPSAHWRNCADTCRIITSCLPGLTSARRMVRRRDGATRESRHQPVPYRPL